MTGTRWNGLVFFGVKSKVSSSKTTARTKAVGEGIANA
jgi:hypothetical protein